MELRKKIKNVIFKLDFNKKIGLGNLIRCLRIGNELPFEKIYFVKHKINKKIKKKIKKNNRIFVQKPKTNALYDAKEFVKNKYVNKQSTLIIDDRKIDHRWHKIVKPYVKKIIVIDDLAINRNYCDIYVNYKITKNKNLRRKVIKLNQKNTKICLGENYVILDRELKTKKKNHLPKKILINFGNSFDFSKAKKLIRNVANSLPNKIQIIICIGLLSKNYNYIYDLSKKYKNVKIIYKQVFIEDILNDIDLFIGSCGTALFENSYLNIPSIFFSISIDQKNDIDDLKRIGHHYLFEQSEINSIKILELINYMYNNYKNEKKKFLTKKIILTKKGISNFKKLIVT